VPQAVLEETTTVVFKLVDQDQLILELAVTQTPALVVVATTKKKAKKAPAVRALSLFDIQFKEINHGTLCKSTK
jgi:hypothetical protein